MGYYIDLEQMSLDQYRDKLENAYLPPSRMILREQRKERFEHFKKHGIRNVKELIQVLKKKPEAWQGLECLSEEYLKILLRELNSTLPKPTKLADFTGISKEAIASLEKAGLSNTRKLYDKVLTKESRKKLAITTSISETEILELAKLTDLSRIKWVGATFARMLYDLGIDSVKKASETNPEQLHIDINRMNKEQKIYKGQIGLNDIRIFVEAAGEVPVEVEE